MNRLTTKSSCICTSNASTFVSLITNTPVFKRSAVKGNKKKNNNKKEEKQNNFCIFLNFVRFVLFLYFSKLQFAQIIWQTKSHKCCNRYSPLSTLHSPPHSLHCCPLARPAAKACGNLPAGHEDVQRKCIDVEPEKPDGVVSEGTGGGREVGRQAARSNEITLSSLQQNVCKTWPKALQGRQRGKGNGRQQRRHRCNDRTID